MRILLSIGVLFFSHCTLVDDVEDYQFFEPRLVVNGSISPQLGVYLEISPLLDPEQRYALEGLTLADAAASLWDAHGNWLADIPYDETAEAYQLNSLPIRHETTYELRIAHPDYPLASSMVTIPPPLQDLTGSFEDFDRELEETRIRVTYLEPSERMYFQMEVVGFEERLVTYPKDYPGDASPEVSTFFCNRNNPLFYDNSCLTSGTQERQVDLWLSRVRSRSQSAYQPMFYIYDSLSLVLSSITPEYKDYGAYIDQIPEDLDLLFADQRTTPTNVQGGYGMIAGKSVHIIKIHIP